MFRIRPRPVAAGTSGPETDPVALPAINAHKAAVDPHGDRGYADTRIAALVNAAPAALDTLAEIDAQLASDESGAAAMQAAINQRALQTDLLALRLSNLPDVNVAGIADGQALVWNAAAQRFIPFNPTGGKEVAYSENGTGVATGPIVGASGAFAATVAIPNTDIIVPPSNGVPIYLDAWVLGAQMAAGAGLAFVEIWETTAAAVMLSRSQSTPLPNNISANALRNFGVLHTPVRLGAVAAQRTFQLRMNVYGNGAAPSWQALNTNALGFKSWLRAMSA